MFSIENGLDWVTEVEAAVVLMEDEGVDVDGRTGDTNFEIAHVEERGAR